MALANKPKKISLTKQHLATKMHYSLWIWGAKDHMGLFYEMGFGFHPYYNDPKHPFRKTNAVTCCPGFVKQISHFAFITHFP